MRTKLVMLSVSLVILMVGAETLMADPPSAGLVLWLKADTGLMGYDPEDPNTILPAQPGYKITQWQDQSGNNAHANAYTGAADLVSVDFPNGAHPSLHFDGNDGYSLANHTVTHQTNFTFFIVCSVEGTTGSTSIFSNYSAAGWGIGRSDDGNTSYRPKYWSAPGGYVDATSSFVDSENHIYIATLEEAKTRQIFLFNENQGQTGYGYHTSAALIGYDPASPSTIGMLQLGWGQYHIGTITEILMYDSTSAQLIASVNAYLNEKYGINVTPQLADPDSIYMTAGTFCACNNTGFMDVAGRWATKYPAGTWQLALAKGSLADFLADPNGLTVDYLANSPDSAAIMEKLVPGNTYTYTFAIENPQTTTYWSTQLFFENEQYQPNNGKVGISVFAARQTDPNDPNPPFTPNTSASVMGWPMDSSAGPGVVYENASKEIRVTLTRYACYDPSVYPFDVCHPMGGYPVFDGNGTRDMVGEFTLVVESFAATCEDMTIFYDMDFNHDCYVNLEDFAQFVQKWLKCNDPQNPDCDKLE